MLTTCLPTPKVSPNPELRPPTNAEHDETRVEGHNRVRHVVLALVYSSWRTCLKIDRGAIFETSFIIIRGVKRLRLKSQIKARVLMKRSQRSRFFVDQHLGARKKGS